MAKINVSYLTVGNLAVNCWFLINEDTKEALVLIVFAFQGSNFMTEQLGVLIFLFTL